MVTAEKVWEALAGVPDPEIPVISLVDLGVVRDVEVRRRPRAGRVHADVSRLPRAGGHARADGRRGPRARRRAGDRRRPRRLVVDRPHHAGGPPQAGGVGLRPAPAPRGRRADPRPARRAGVPLPVLRLDETRSWRTSSARRRAARSATAVAAGNRSSSSRRSRQSGRPSAGACRATVRPGRSRRPRATASTRARARSGRLALPASAGRTCGRSARTASCEHGEGARPRAAEGEDEAKVAAQRASRTAAPGRAALHDDAGRRLHTARRRRRRRGLGFDERSRTDPDARYRTRPAQRPLKRGSLFSRNAATPSAKSSVRVAAT